MTARDLPALLAEVRAFLRDCVLPLEPRVLQEEWRDLLPELAAVRREARRRGLWAPFLPRS